MPDFDLDAALADPRCDHIQCQACGSTQVRLSEAPVTNDGLRCTLHMLCNDCGNGSQQKLVWKHGEDGANRRVGTSGPAADTDCYHCHTPGRFSADATELWRMPRENDEPQQMAVAFLFSCRRCHYGFWDIYQPEGSEYAGL